MRGARARGRRLVGLLACLLAAAGCAAGPPCEREAPRRLQLLHLNDVYRLDPNAEDRGGLARVATLVRGLRAEADHTVFSLGGDTLSPSLLSTLVQGRQMIEAWNLLGLDVATLGNHEFDRGLPLLLERMAESRFSWVSSNVRDRRSGRPIGGARPWLRLDAAGVRVGMVGLTAEDTASTSSPGPDVVFEPPVAAARAALAEMGPVDVRVALTHLEIAHDRDLARAVPLDVILGGHDHDPMLERAGGTPIVKTGADAVNLGQVTFETRCGRVLARRERLIPVDAGIAEAPDVTAMVRRYAALATRELDAQAGVTRVPLDARTDVIRREPTALGGFLAEAMRARAGADVALLNAGSIRGDRLIAPGPLARRDVHELLPFGNVLALVEVSGADLREALERSADHLPRPAGHYLQVAGVAFGLDPAAPPGRRVSRVTVAGQPLDPARAYRVAVPDYLARGQDGFTMLARGRVLLSPEAGPALVDVLLEALAAGRVPGGP
jgi:2',3'-cyclic-nucleotide 2'-phosphodiesterase (5'-nucleotidase family)